MSEETIEEKSERAIGSTAFGVSLLALGCCVLYFSKDIRGFSLGTNDPGPKAVPIATGVIMLIGGIWQIAVSVWYEKLVACDWTAIRSRIWESRQSLVAVLALVVYLIALQIIGFRLSTLLFVIGFLKFLKSSWLEAVATSILVAVVVHVLFTIVFKITLPTGSLIPW